jgi:protein TonB
VAKIIAVALLLLLATRAPAAESSPAAPPREPAKIYQPSALTSSPVLIYSVKPEYPTDFRRGGLPGEVVVRFVVDVDGAVKNPRVLRSNRRQFEYNALQAVRQWKYQPGKIEGIAVKTQMQVAVAFGVADGSNN